MKTADLTSQTGFTLAELLVAAFILLVGICGTFLLYIGCMQAAQFSWDSTVAVTHAQSILEEMQSRTDLAAIISTDWNDWAQKQKLDTLPEESVHVAYADPNADPLAIQVNIQWQRKNLAQSIVLATILKR